MLLLGLTGSIATGKSTVSSILAAPPYDLPVVDADKIARQVVEPGSSGYKQIVSHFGPSTPDLLVEATPENGGERGHNGKGRPLNRPALGRRVFGEGKDSDRKALNKIVHPAVRREMYRQMIYAYLSGSWAVVLDVPLLFESGWEPMCGTIMVVAVKDPAIQMQRLRARDAHLTEEDAKNRVAAQWDVRDKAERCLRRGEGAGVVVWNDGEKEELKRSAIDDSFMPIYIQPSIAPSYAPSRYNGPRSGHWTVSNESGSGIDDRCPTVWSAVSGRGSSEPYGATAVKPIRASLLKAVGHAGVVRKLAAEAEVAAQYQADHERQASIRSETKQLEESAPKGVYVPRNETARVAKARAKDNEKEKAAATTAQAKKTQPASRPEKARASLPPPVVKSNKPSPVVPFAPSSQPRGIRIVSKDGKEAFVQLPSLPRISTVPDRTRAAAIEGRAVKATQKSEKPAKAQAEPAPSLRDETAKIAAEALMSGDLPATKKQKGQKEPKQKPAPVMPLTPPRSERASEVGLGIGGLYENTSKVASVAASKAVSARSLQEAIRVISQNSKKSATPQAINDTWVRAKTPSQRRSEGVVDNDADARPRSNHDFQAVGEGWAGVATSNLRSREASARQKIPSQVDEGWARAPTPANGSRQASARQKTPSPANGFAPAGEGWVQTASPNQASARQKTPSHNNGFQPAGETWLREASPHNLNRHSSARDPKPTSVLKVLSPLINDKSSSTREHAFNGNGLGSQNGREEPTVFAGKGWISPHPLSVAPTRFASPPQSHISLPFTTPHGREMSYEDWKAVQDGQVEHKRFSRAESKVSGQILTVAESIARGGSERVSVRGSVAGSQVYHKATVESEHGSRRSGSRGSAKPVSEAYGWNALPGFDGTSEEKAPASEVSGSAYQRYLENIVSQNKSGQLAEAQNQGQLAMPWNGQDEGNFAQHPMSARRSGASGSSAGRYVDRSFAPSWQGRLDQAEQGFGGW
ncbi:Dephospho-CoA kinase cab5 [Elasticomyces elasticus]|nr:Dephospho-CoA kinase cab5 [Elasticomyces elasticus]KAK4967455.1 Dephospho-CoA kinase cab5 [Elasticomyces elasticus]